MSKFNEIVNTALDSIERKVKINAFDGFCITRESLTKGDCFKQVGIWCNKITRDLEGDYDRDIPLESKYNKSTIKLYEKATVYPENKEKIIWMSFDSMDDLEDYLK